jgi:hypothetical protein
MQIQLNPILSEFDQFIYLFFAVGLRLAFPFLRPTFRAGDFFRGGDFLRRLGDLDFLRLGFPPETAFPIGIFLIYIDDVYLSGSNNK